MFKKILLLVILATSVVGCELLDPKGWKEAREDMRKEGRRCFKDSSGYYYCKDRYGNRVY